MPHLPADNNADTKRIFAMIFDIADLRTPAGQCASLERDNNES